MKNVLVRQHVIEEEVYIPDVYLSDENMPLECEIFCCRSLSILKLVYSYCVEVDSTAFLYCDLVEEELQVFEPKNFAEDTKRKLITISSMLPIDDITKKVNKKFSTANYTHWDILKMLGRLSDRLNCILLFCYDAGSIQKISKMLESELMTSLADE